MTKKTTKRRQQRLPSYRLHKPSGQAVVTISGKDHYLGEHGTPASEKRYRELMAQWLANNRQPLKPATAVDADDDALTVAELALEFQAWADETYRKDGKPTQEPGCVRLALKPVVEMFGALGVDQFGPLALRSVREHFIERGYYRSTINSFVDKIRRCFRWGVGRELVNPSVVVALAAVEGLRKGRSTAKEPTPTRAPSDETIAKLLPHLRPVFRALVVVQRATGARAGELCCMRPCDVDQSGPVWWFTPRRHKGEHHGKVRRIAIGPKAIEALTPFIGSATPSGAVFRLRNGKPVTPARYAEELRKRIEKLREQKKLDVEPFRPHALRHARLIEVRDALGLDHAQSVGGHSHAATTEIYAKLSDDKAKQAALESG